MSQEAPPVRKNARGSVTLCIEFVFLAVQLIMARAAYKSPLKYGKTAEIVNILALIVILLCNIAIIVLNIMG